MILIPIYYEYEAYFFLCIYNKDFKAGTVTVGFYHIANILTNGVLIERRIIRKL